MISCSRLDKAALPPWSYDATYQLIGEHRTGTTPYEDTYSYDQVGNRLTKVHDGARTTYSYDAANQLEWSEDASGRTTYTFDADGNQQVTLEPNGDRTTNTWDYENRLTRVELPSGIRNTMAYEPGGLRVKLEESTATKKFVWDEQNYLAETDDNDDTQVVYTNEPRLYGNLVSQRRGTDSHWYHFDAIGSTRELTDDSAVVTDTRLYGAWGERPILSGSTPFVFQFVGERGYFQNADRESVYVRARVYRPIVARWLIVDPLFDSRPYAYARNNPIRNVDPSGLIDVEPVEEHERLNNLACGDTAEVVWDFVITRPSRTNCWLIQRVTVECMINECDDEDPKEPVTFTYYEAWPVPANEPRTAVRVKQGTDWARAPIPDNTYGRYEQKGEIRFYCGVDVLKWSKDVLTLGKDPCKTTAGGLRHIVERSGNRDLYKFWTDIKFRESGERWFKVSWECCHDCGPQDVGWVRADARPRATEAPDIRPELE